MSTESQLQGTDDKWRLLMNFGCSSRCIGGLAGVRRCEGLWGGGLFHSRSSLDLMAGPFFGGRGKGERKGEGEGERKGDRGKEGGEGRKVWWEG